MTPTLNHILRTKSKETIYDINRLGKNKVIDADINPAWAAWNLQEGYITIHKFRKKVNELVDSNRIGRHFEQPRY